MTRIAVATVSLAIGLAGGCAGQEFEGTTTQAPPNFTETGTDSDTDTDTANTDTDACVEGLVGCACLPGGGCEESLSCVQGICMTAACPVGRETCPCTEGGGCDPGLTCLSMVCVDPGE